MPTTPLRVLILEDNPGDAHLLRLELESSGLSHTWRHVDDEAGYVAALDEPWDVVLADYQLPDMEAPRALELLKERALDTPLIIVTGTISEEVAVDCMKQGAADYLLKDRLGRLGPAVRRAIEERDAHRAARQEERRRQMLASGLRSVCSATQELLQSPDMPTLLRRAVELPREALGIERCSLYLLESIPEGRALRGTFGTALSGQTLDESHHTIGESEWPSLVHEPTPGDALWIVRENAKIAEWSDEAREVPGIPWQAVTAIPGTEQQLGVIFNDSAISSSPLDPVQQEILAVYASMLGGILERRRADEALRHSELRFRTLFDNAADAIYLVDPQGQFVDANDRACQTLGYTRDELLRMEVPQIEVSAPWPERSADEWVRRLRNTVTLEGCHRRKDGTTFPVEARMCTIHMNDRPVLLASSRDVSDRKLAQERIQVQLDRILSLRSIDIAIASTLDLRVTLGIVLEQTSARIGVDAVAIWLQNGGTPSLCCSVSRGFGRRKRDGTELPLGEGLVGRSALERRALWDTNAMVAEGLDGQTAREEGFAFHGAMPLLAKGKVQGVLEICHRRALPMEGEAAEWIDFLDTLAGQAAIAIDNAALFDDLQRSNSDLTVAYDSTLEGWSRALDLRDKETEGHTRRVTRDSVRLASMMGLADEDIMHLRRGALLHDIGKMGIPDRILHKPGPLDEAEWAIMKLHPVYAYEWMAPVPFLKPALDIPYCHHEKWDGSGYPRGLREEQIPLAARIFAVVDVWDALTSDRPYRPAWSPERALAHIQASIGTHFDPTIVKAFLSMQRLEK